MIARPAELSWSASGDGEQRQPLQPGAYRIGRDPSAEICVQAAGVSQQHALLECVGGHWLLSDLQSTNGLWCGGCANGAAPRLHSWRLEDWACSASAGSKCRWPQAWAQAAVHSCSLTEPIDR